MLPRRLSCTQVPRIRSHGPAAPRTTVTCDSDVCRSDNQATPVSLILAHPPRSRETKPGSNFASQIACVQEHSARGGDPTIENRVPAERDLTAGQRHSRQEFAAPCCRARHRRFRGPSLCRTCHTQRSQARVAGTCAAVRGHSAPAQVQRSQTPHCASYSREHRIRDLGRVRQVQAPQQRAASSNLEHPSRTHTRAPVQAKRAHVRALSPEATQHNIRHLRKTHSFRGLHVMDHDKPLAPGNTP